jgi:riboflavin transporter FmnP
MQTQVKSRTLKLAKMALMIAVSVICSFIHFPILPMAPFLEFEVSDIPILVAAFAFGPIPGLVVAVVSILLHDLMMGPTSGPYGMIMHIIAAATLVLVAGFLYQKFKTKKGALISLIVGGLCMAAVMGPANLLITPIFMGAPIEVVVAMLPTIIIPFNLIKVAIICVVVFFLYKRISPFLHKEWALGQSKGTR